MKMKFFWIPARDSSAAEAELNAFLGGHRVVHHALMNIAGPCLERSAVHHSYACRIGRGNLAAVQHAAACTRKQRYFLKVDVRRYFDSIQHETLRGLLRRRFKDGALLAVLDRVLDSFDPRAGGIVGRVCFAPMTPSRDEASSQNYPPSSGSVERVGDVTRRVVWRSRITASANPTAPNTPALRRGLPIGTLTSQYFANFYLDGLDHWVLETLRCSAYVRYMDDIVLWHDDAEVLAEWHGQLAAWLTEERGLELKGLSKPTPCREGLPFLGYRITPRGVLLSRASRHRFVSRLRENERAQAAGELTHSDLQRRTDALLAYTDVAHCQTWRRKVVLGFSPHRAGVAETSALWPATLSRAKAHDDFAGQRDFRRPTAPSASCAAAPGTTTPATAAQPTATGTTVATTGTTRACAWPQLTRDAAAPRLTRSANCREAGKPPPGAGREASRPQPNVPGGDSKVVPCFSTHQRGGAETSALWPAELSRAEAHDYFLPTP